MGIVKVSGLKKYYCIGKTITKALDGIDFEVFSGEFVAIVGSSGSGKSTLLHMIGGLDTPTEGAIFINATKLSEMQEEQLTIFRRQHIGFIFQNYNLMPILNVTENITLPVLLDKQNVDEDLLNSIVKELKIIKKLDAMPNELSGGEQQRVAIARALITKPDIILADEPTGNLDSRNSDDVIDLLQLSSQKFGQTIILITHDKDIALKADRIVEIMDGKIVDRGRYNNV